MRRVTGDTRQKVNIDEMQLLSVTYIRVSDNSSVP